MKNFKSKLIYVFIAIITAVLVVPVSASTTDGTVDSTDKYAWGENIGWINFGTTEGNVHITDSALSGYAWSENAGWISLNCSNDSSCATVDHKVANDGAGNLSGYAWSENTGWINFNPTYGGVTINSSGEFLGYAWGENIGWIVFNCATTDSCSTVDYKVKTDWRLQASRPQCNNSLDDDGDGLTDYPNDPGCSSLTDDDEVSYGGGLPPGAYDSPVSPTPTIENPEVNFSVVINNNSKYTNNKKVNLKFNTGSDTVRMAISNTPDFIGASQIPYQEEIQWELAGDCRSENEVADEVCEVYVKFYTQYGVASEVVSDSIIIFINPPEIELTQVKDSYFTDEDVIISGITKSNSVIIYYLDRKLLDSELQSDIDGNWIINLGNLKKGTHKIRVISKDLAGNFSNSLEISFTVKEKVIDLNEELKINLPEDSISQQNSQIIEDEVVETEVIEVKDAKIEDSQIPEEVKNSEVKNSLELIKEIIPLSSFNKLKNWTEKFSSIKDSLSQTINVSLVKIGDLSKITLNLPSFSKIMEENQNGEIPTEVVFVKVANNKIDLNSVLVFGDEGDLEQKINIITGKTLNLFIKPEYPADSIKGYFVFKSEYDKENNENFSDSSFLRKVTKKAIAKEDSEQFLVLSEFEYFDQDQDGIYIADVESPKTKGEYEIVTMINYQDPLLGTKIIKLTTIIDPKGYIFEKSKDREFRIPNATISIFQFNHATNEFQLWQGREYNQKNPQITDNTGEYSFLVPSGTYYLQAEAPGYSIYKGEPFEVIKDNEVHFNIELKSSLKNSVFTYWKYTSLLLIIAVLLVIIILNRKKKKGAV